MSGDRYISQNALITEIAKIHGNLSTKKVGQAIWDTPTADVVEVRHGEWIVITEERDTIFGKTKLQHKECSICGYPMGLCGSLYCGNCGAKMDGERSENGKS